MIKIKLVRNLCLFSIGACLIACYRLSVIPAAAQSRVESENYTIQFPNFNSGAGIPTSDNYLLNTTIGQTAAGLYSSDGYRVKSGFQYISSIIPFSFSISDISITFGSLVPNTPSTQTADLTVSSGGASGYSVMAQENHPLKTQNEASAIADTVCDSSDCNESTAGVWSSPTIYGFGYNMSGDDVPAGFVDSTYFKQFSDLSTSESAQTVMSSENVGRSRTSTITYKVNVSSLQPAGTYYNTVTFTAIPGY